MFLNNLQIIRLSDSEKQIKKITRSPGQYKNLEIPNISVEEGLSDEGIQAYRKCCVVFDDMLESNQKLIDPFFTRERHTLCDVYYSNQSCSNVPKRTIGV